MLSSVMDATFNSVDLKSCSKWTSELKRRFPKIEEGVEGKSAWKEKLQIWFQRKENKKK